MDTIKKKMLAMKNEKDAALDRAEQLEQNLRDTETAKNEVEEERDNLQKKIMQMETDLDQVQEGLQDSTASLEEAEKSKTQVYSSDEEEEMLIVVLDDDDDLVIGKSKASPTISPNKSTTRNTNAELQYSQKQNITPHNRNSPSRSKHRESTSSGGTKSKHRTQTTRDQRYYQPNENNNRTYQRPIINTQKLAQRLNNIKQDQYRQSSRAGSPRLERITPDKSSSLPSSMHSSMTDSTSSYTDKPHAVIAKPVERRKKRRRIRPDPEGAPLEFADLDEFDKLIYNDEPIFSDYGTDEEDSKDKPNRPQRRPGLSIAAFAIGLGLNSNTMIKYTIIGTELQNIVRVSLKMYEEEIQGLNRRLQLCEEKLENTEERLASASSKLEEASQAADESERGRKVLQDLNNQNEERISVLEEMLKDSQEQANESERKYDETCRKLVITEAEATRNEDRAETAEHKVKELEEELHVVTNSLRSLEISENKASQREEAYEETIRDLNERLKDAENRASEFERQTNKMQKENESLEDELLQAKEKYKVLSDELETTLTDINGM